jgi:CRISPR-associated protein Cas2
MYVLITYDVSTTTARGRRRLQKVAKLCDKKGQRVQNSVFECSLDPAQLEILKKELLDVIDTTEDSLRIYNLGNNWRNRVEHFGAKEPYDPEDTLLV